MDTVRGWFTDLSSLVSRILARGPLMSVCQRLACAAVLLLAFQSIGRTQDLVLSGTIVTPDKIIPKGWITVKAGRIESILEKPPAAGDVPVVDTDGIIFPGFIDLHNHPMYNIFTRWQPAGRFRNRYEWRDFSQYADLVGTPGGALQRKGDQVFCDVDEYAEVRALIGGTTSITGISPRRGTDSQVPNCLLGLVRNLDWASGFYGLQVGHERVQNALGVSPRDMKEGDAVRLRGLIQTNAIDLLLVHLAEGAPLDMESTLEFLALKARGLLTKHTGIIHGIALGPDDFKEIQAVGASLIWSPRSNLELYGVTTDVVEARKQGVTIALAPDWSPTGSTNMGAELKYASRFNREQLSGSFSDQDLFEMATVVPARIASIDSKVGSLRPGLYADLFVLKGNSSKPFEAISEANPGDIQLVVIGGVPIYGSHKLMSQFKVTPEPVEFCDVKMELNLDALPAGRFADVQQRLKDDLKAYGVSLAHLAECAH